MQNVQITEMVRYTFTIQNVSIKYIPALVFGMTTDLFTIQNVSIKFHL